MAKTHPTLSGYNAYMQALTQYSFPEAIGNVYFVSSVAGSNSTGYGYTPDYPVASIGYAVSLATADNQDYIVCMPGHVETLGSAGALALNKAGLTVVGMGAGRQRGKINYGTAVGASCDVSAARCCLRNLILTVTGFDAITAALNITAADFSLLGCEVELADASSQAVLGILATAAATRMRIEDCDFHGTGDAGTTNAIQYAAADDVRILRCRFHGAYATASGAIQNTAAAKDSVIDDCTINNLTAACTKAAIFHASTTGMIRRCHLQTLDAVTAPLTAAAMSLMENYWSGTIGTGGVLI